MARSRNIKPGFFVNADLVELDPLVRLLFIGLWTIADREGRLEDRPSQIKMQILPGDDINTGQALGELHTKLFITRYSVAGNNYIQINNFKKHQNPHVKELQSTIPPMSQHIEITGGNTGIIPASCKHRACLVLAGLIPDSLLLIPDSLFPIKPLSTDVDPPPIGERTEDKIKVPYDLILAAYNKFCPSMPRVRDLTDKRRTSIRLRHLKYLKHPTGPLEVIDTVFRKAEASDFLSGRDGKWTNCNFDWLMNENNMVKVIEGNYDNKTIPQKMTASKGVNRLLDRIQQMQEEEDAQP